MLRKYFTKETHKKVKLLIKTNAMSTTDFNPLQIRLIPYLNSDIFTFKLGQNLVTKLIVALDYILTQHLFIRYEF